MAFFYDLGTQLTSTNTHIIVFRLDPNPNLKLPVSVPLPDGSLGEENVCVCGYKMTMLTDTPMTFVSISLLWSEGYINVLNVY